MLTDRDLPRDYIAATEFTHQRATAWIREDKPHLRSLFSGNRRDRTPYGGRLKKSRGYFRRIDEILGVPALLVFLGIGMLAGSEGLKFSAAEGFLLGAIVRFVDGRRGGVLDPPRERAILVVLPVINGVAAVSALNQLLTFDYARNGILVPFVPYTRLKGTGLGTAASLAISLQGWNKALRD